MPRKHRVTFDLEGFPYQVFETGPRRVTLCCAASPKVTDNKRLTGINSTVQRVVCGKCNSPIPSGYLSAAVLPKEEKPKGMKPRTVQLSAWDLSILADVETDLKKIWKRESDPITKRYLDMLLMDYMKVRNHIMGYK